MGSSPHAVDHAGAEITFNPNLNSNNGVDNNAGVVALDGGTALASVACQTKRRGGSRCLSG